ncbi:MAG: hypothetical protein JW731_13200 [Bacteroidales bacterium]|nr:hypothetical protein [Bacteroidales bacterium]
MKSLFNRFITLVLILLTIHYTIIAQNDKYSTTDTAKLAPLSAMDSIALVNLPELKLPDWLKGPNPPTLPEITDNSQQIYWRPVFAQSMYECGQASGIGLGFTYAINRLRNLPSNVPENQYPAYFTWNFGNEGSGWSGVSYFHSFEIVKLEGNPTVAVYGGMIEGGHERWMSGYNNYYHAMQNRLADIYKIDVSKEEGINTLRNWIHNHLDGSDVGGVANFYTNAPSGMPTLPSGTPEAGKYVVTGWSYANHGLTICGYHDSIRWDYNSDGQYTNNIDLNGDGIITPRDWEIGGFKFANTYSGGPSFGNNGFCYMTYKSCADPYGNGGIWDNAAHVIYAKANTEPLLTAKINMTYNCRNRIRVQIGMSTNTNATSPDYILGFPIFNYQGGCQYMQGDTTVEANKTIEFGLDITPLLNILGTGTPARYFLVIDENDPEGWGWGQVNSFSIIDYNNGVQEITSTQSNVAIVSNGQTLLWANHTVNFNDIEIISEVLPTATIYEPYSTQLQAAGGTQPYIWEFDRNYSETFTSGTFPSVNTEQLNPGNNDDGYATKSLGFSFPFHGSEYNEVRINVDGYISFDDMVSWPYAVYDFFNFTKNKLISPFQSNLVLNSADADGMWYNGNEDLATFRWKASVNGDESASNLNFAVRLYKTGEIRFYYGTNTFTDIEWVAGLSAGDNLFYQFSALSNHASIPYGYVTIFNPFYQPVDFNLTRDGILSGIPSDEYANLPIKVRVTDENNLKTSKEVVMPIYGLLIDEVTINAEGDQIIEYGEEVFLTVSIKNISAQAISGAEMTIFNTDTFITLNDNYQNLGNFSAGETKYFTDAFQFNVDYAIPDGYFFELATQIEENLGEIWESSIGLTGYSAILSTGSVVVYDEGNGFIEPGEIVDLQVEIVNDGGAKATNILTELLIDDEYATIINGSANLAQLVGNSTANVIYTIHVSESTPIGYNLAFNVDIEADFNISGSGQFNIVVGQRPLLIIDLDDNNNSAPYIEASMDNLGMLYETSSSFPLDLNIYPGIFVCLGIYPNNHVLTSNQGINLANYLNNGGKLFMEGGDTWAYDAQTAAHTMFFIDGTDDGTSDMLTVIGKPSTFTQGMSFVYTGENSWMDHLVPLGSAFTILENQSPVYGTAIAYDGGTYKTIGTAHEFGGLADGGSPSTKDELMTAYLDFFELLPPPVFAVDLTVLLEGPYNGTEMNTALNNQSLIPLSQPYNTSPWNYNVPQSVDFIPNSNIVDWLLIECRDAPDAASAIPSTSFGMKAAFLLKDGSVVGMDGSSPLYFQHKIDNGLFIVVWHRNHLGILSANPLSGFNNIYARNFSTGPNTVYGGASAHKEIVPGKWGMRSGDGDGDGEVSWNDIITIWSANAGRKQYHKADYNLDGQIDNTDKNGMVFPNLGYTGQSD